MKIRELTIGEAKSRAPTIARRQFLAGGVAFAVSGLRSPTSTAAPPDVFSINDILRATEMLRSANVPPHTDGSYTMFLHPNTAAEVRLDSLLIGRKYRTWLTAWSLLEHERRREARGKRGHVGAEEIFNRASLLG